MTETSRRAVLRAGALAAAAVPLAGPLVVAETAAAAGGVGSGPGGVAGRASAARRLYTRSRFAAVRGATFTVVEPSRTWRMRLAEVADLSPDRAGAEGSFALTFRLAAAAGTAGPAQGTFLLRRPGFPSTTLFLVPSDARRRTYQAVVNNL